ncbi:IclR family transcriptional regulator [Roseateles sp. BYS180W]|uniref:IclR family transcriptional regulator n=1 Tax=Roseateles rivi TaxID=3299028 RepID=A0ABW7FT94_9BURK
MHKENTNLQRYLRNEPHRVPLGYEEYAGDKQFATTLARGIELIRCFSADETVLSNAELAERTGLARPTVSRLTYTLVLLGYLKPSAKYGKYQLGSALLSATYPLMASISLRHQARTAMEMLADETGGQVSMGIRDRLNIVLVETSRSRRRARGQLQGPMADTGLSLPIAGTAIGRAWLAGCDEATRAAVLNEIRVKTASDWAQFERPIGLALKDCARDGFCVIEGDLLHDIHAVGVPYGRTAEGELVAFNCAFQGPLPPSSQGKSWLRDVVGLKLLNMVRLLREGRHA